MRRIHIIGQQLKIIASTTFWNNNSIYMCSTSKDWKTGYVIKTGPKISNCIKQSTTKGQKSNCGILVDLWKTWAILN